MLRNLKTIVILIILIAIVIIGWLWYSAPSTMAPAADTSDAALQNDLSAVDAQMTGLDADAASVDASINQ